jgi:hypothetical protein
MQQQVVAGRVNIASGPLDDEPQGALDETGGVALVIPEGLRIEAVEAQTGAQQERQQDEEQRPAMGATEFRAAHNYVRVS